uniref:histidine kinase dimerization/phosphoacceptor domain -containing protein n=1 Tax=Flavobacterium sp. TaxID=239 RepID=UPI0037518928
VLNKEKIGHIVGNKISFETIDTDGVIKDFIKSGFKQLQNNALVEFDNTYYIKFKNNIYKILYKNNKLYTEFSCISPTNDNLKFSYSEKDDLYIFGSTSQGMAVVNPNKFHTIYLKNNHNFSDYSIIKKNGNWYNYNGWIYNTKLKKLEHREINNYEGNMRFLLKYKDDYFYQAKKNELISLINLKTRTPFKINNNLNFLTSFTYVGKTLWLSNEKNVAFLSRNKIFFDNVIKNKIVKTQIINTIKSVGNNLIIATNKGVILYKPLTHQINYISGLENVNARYIKLLNNSTFWVGCYGEGLFLVSKNKVYKVIDKNIDITTTHAIEEDKFGYLWISTNNGLLTVNKNKALANILKQLPINSYVFLTKDGLPTNEFNGGSTFSSLKEDNGILGFPSMKGFVWFQPQEIKKHLFSGTIVMDQVLVDNKVNYPMKHSFYSIPQKTEIITLKFSYGYYFNRENITVSYKFEDQKSWKDTKEKTIQITRYKKGIHKLFIKISTHGFDNRTDVIKSFTLDFKPRNHETKWFWAAIAALSIAFLHLAYLIGLHFNKKREKKLKEKIEEKTFELQENISELSITKKIILDALTEKEILLKEVHHRVKNNLQLIISMLNIQARRSNYSDIYDFLKKGESRIITMALIHQNLYQKEESLDKINFQLYGEDLAQSISETFENSNTSITIEAKDITLNLTTAIPLGLIINELITNALKHAFPNSKKGKITINIKQLLTNQYELIVIDNGIGFNEHNIEKKSFGLELINLLTNQLNGKVEFSNDKTTKYRITFEEVVNE